MPVTISIITSLYQAEAFLDQFLNYVSKIVNPEECELILVHNDPSARELDIIAKHSDLPIKLIHLKVPREGLYSSWNRAIMVSSGKYMAIWNVDDIRTSDSLALQKSALESNDSAALCYGDFYASSTYGEHKDVFYEYDDNFKRLRKESFERHLVGGFPMWKKEIHEKIGYFDEQLKLVADWEFQVRTTLSYDLVKSERFLGYFLADAPHKLSSNRRLQAAEQTLVQIRYKVYHKVLVHYLFTIKRFRINQVLEFGKWHDLKNYLPPLKSAKLDNFANMAIMPFAYCSWIVRKVVTKAVKLVS